MTQPNPSTAQARAIVDELHRQGVDYAVISPGSRSAALAIAFEEHRGVTTRVVTDERSAAFHALGRARASGSPVVVLATSGTALANHLPAVVEAHLSLVPLISISADRPPDLLHVGANQTMNQPGTFGEQVRWSCSIPPAEQGVDGNGYWRSTVAQAVARARGHGARPGPVHLNVAFREPTVPVPDDGRTSAEPYPFSIEGRPEDAPWQTQQRAGPGKADLDLGGRGLIVAGEGDIDSGALAGAGNRHIRLASIPFDPHLSPSPGGRGPLSPPPRSGGHPGPDRAQRPARRTHLTASAPGPDRPVGCLA
jgi:2-succinyl-5-enolpyruvyl-6-hydroxy-3-cyclohexene-1-carboxylate synthase